MQRQIIYLVFLVFFILMIIPTVLIGQTTYYVSSSNGKDSNPGTSEQHPWKTISKVNSVYFFPGDKILFKTGDKWEGEQLIINNGGSIGNSIIYSSFGSGPKPIITLKEELPGWNIEKNWTQINDADSVGKVWSIPYLPSYGIKRMWFNGVEYLSGAYYKKGEVIECPNGLQTSLCYKGSNYDPLNIAPNYFTEETCGLNYFHRFYVNVSDNKLYVYAESNPAVYYSSIKYPGKIYNTSTTNSTLEVKGNYIIISGLDIQGGMQASIIVNGSDYLTIDNCNVGKDAGNSGLNINPGSTTYISDSLIVSNCTVDPDYKILDALEHNEVVTYGIPINGVNRAYFFRNYLKNWKFGFLTVSKSRTNNVFIYDNEITAPDITYGKPIQTGSTGDLHRQRYIYFYRNYMHDLKIHFQISGATRVYIYFNIFDTFTYSLNSHSSPGNSGYGIDMSSAGSIGHGDSIYIFNNTFYNINNFAYRNNNPNNQWFENNLIINVGLTRSAYLLQESQYSDATYKNNLLYRSEWDTSHKLINIPSIGDYTLSQWNRLNGKYDKIISKNLQYVGSLSSLINTDNFTLPNGSPGLNSGTDISTLIPEGFKDQLGNIVRRNNPNIGAIDNPGNELRGIKLFLQGPYSNGSMRTKLISGELIPKTQPFNVSPWNYKGNEYVAIIDSEIVDWVLIELRTSTSSSSTVTRRAAFVRSDGNIVDLDGISPINFNGISNGDYYTVIRHRNHLGIMSAIKVPLSEFTLSYDFTTSASKAFGNDLANLGDNKYGMYAGDGDTNGVINILDYGSVENNLFQCGYISGDHDLNRVVNVLDYGKTYKNLLKISNVPF